MKRTIDGKPLNSLFSNVSQEKVKTYELAKETFESFVGDNYDVAYSELNTLNVGKALFVTVKATISLIDDAGSRINRDYITSNEIDLQDNQKPINLSVTIDRAEKEAFRRCVCTHFLKTKETSKKEEHNNNSSSTISKQGMQTDGLKVQLTSKLEELQGYNETFRCKGIYNGEEVQLMFWYSMTKKLKQSGLWDRLNRAVDEKETILVTAKKERYKDITQLSVNEVLF